MDRDLLRSAIAVDFLLVTIFYRGGSLLSCIFDHAAINMLGFMLLSGWRLGFCRYMTFKNVLIAGAAGYTMEEVDTAVRYVIPDGNMESCYGYRDKCNAG